MSRRPGAPTARAHTGRRPPARARARPKRVDRAARAAPRSRAGGSRDRRIRQARTSVGNAAGSPMRARASSATGASSVRRSSAAHSGAVAWRSPISPSVAAAIAALPGVPVGELALEAGHGRGTGAASAALVSGETGGIRVRAISAAIAAGVAILPSASCARRATSSVGRRRASATKAGSAASARNAASASIAAARASSLASVISRNSAGVARG